MVPKAITAFLEGNDFEDVIRTAVSLGGYCDTLTCVAGGIAEAFYGVLEEIAAEGRKRLTADMLGVLNRFKPSNLPVYEPFTREEFVRGIADLHIGEWKERYENLYVLDGTQWGISIEYEDGKEPFEISGSNAYPYNFVDLIDFLGINNSDTDEMSDDHDEEE